MARGKKKFNGTITHSYRVRNNEKEINFKKALQTYGVHGISFQDFVDKHATRLIENYNRKTK